MRNNEIYIHPAINRVRKRSFVSLIQNDNDQSLTNRPVELDKWLDEKLENIVLPGSPSSSSSDVTYDAGNGAWVTATDTGITHTKSGGKSTFNIPDGVRLLNITIRGTSAQAVYQNGIYQDAYVIDAVYAGTSTYNNNYSTLVAPNLVAIDSSTQSLGISDTQPLTYDTGTKQNRITGIGSGSVEVGFNNMNGYAEWLITGSYIAGA